MYFAINQYIKILRVPNNGNFPFCTCVLVDDGVRALLDSSCGSELAGQLRSQGLEVLINTHMHLDHTLNTGELGPVQIWCHGLDAPGIRSIEIYQEMYGFDMFDGRQLGRALVKHFALQPRAVSRELKDGELLDFGHVRLRVVHTPGHTPGHCAFHDEENDMLFSADIDLGPAGPFYAHRCSNIDDYLESIQKCIDLNPGVVVAGHNGVVKGDLKARFLAYRDKILRREEKILFSLQVPRSLEELAEEHNFLIPRLDFGSFQQYFNKHGVLKHLERLGKMGLIASDQGRFFRT